MNECKEIVASAMLTAALINEIISATAPSHSMSIAYTRMLIRRPSEKLRRPFLALFGDVGVVGAGATC